jgi:hypothetical protein
VRLWLVCDELWVVIYVWDVSSQMPVRCDAGPDAEGGRGLLVIDALSTNWGAYRKDTGKVVWVMIRRASTPQPERPGDDNARHDHTQARTTRIARAGIGGRGPLL